jgi:hypothetical protein
MDLRIVELRDNKIPTWLLQDLKDKGILAKLYRYGLINYKASVMLEVRLKVDALMRQGKSRGQAVVIVADEINLSRVTIYGYL